MPEQETIQPITLVMDSCTVGWATCGLSDSKIQLIRHDNSAVERLLDPVMVFLEANFRERTYAVHDAGIWFCYKKDAAIFKLFFHDYFIDNPA
jgi:hypothetical protein